MLYGCGDSFVFLGNDEGIKIILYIIGCWVSAVNPDRRTDCRLADRSPGRDLLLAVQAPM